MEKSRILITDDDMSIRATLELILKKQGYEVESVENGSKALDKIRYGKFDVAVLDYKLPDTDGLILARDIKNENKNVEVIILSGKATLESAIEAVKEDVFDYLLKPVNPGELIKVIDEALEKQRLIRENQELIWELKKKNKELERLNNFKGGLISMLSHDLRSPISSLKGFNESFIQGFLGELTEQQIKVIKTENKVIDSMVELINGLLDIEQLEAGKLKMKKKLSSIEGDVVDPLMERMSILFKEKNIEVEYKSDDNLPKIELDPNRITQVLQNLVQNALKFTPEKGKIFVDVKNTDIGIEVSVKDTGKGIERNELNAIFEAFYSKDKMTSGRGLGLAISKEIIKAHNGMIWAESKGEGQGSRFVFILPKDAEKSPDSDDKKQ